MASKLSIIDMKIAIIAWGSLCWDPRELQIEGEWQKDGPNLPIEFARISSGNRLTLVIRRESTLVPTLYAKSSLNTLEEARENLKTREGTENIENIGFIDFINDTNYARQSNKFILDILRNWNKDKKFDAIIWSDFPPRFRNVLNKILTLNNVIAFLENLEPEEKKSALYYILKAPTQIKTELREGIESHFNN